jgi:RNA polymerase sigma-70 factor (ECF subfamily)
MRKNKGDMELALQVPQPRLRAVPADAAAPPLDASEATDAELLARVGEHDSEAFEILYGRYVRPVFSLALRRLGDRGHAEDAVQEAFAAIWRSASTYRPERGAAGTRSSTGCAATDLPPTPSSRSSRRQRPGPTSGRRTRSSRGACTARSRSFRRASAR